MTVNDLFTCFAQIRCSHRSKEADINKSVLFALALLLPGCATVVNGTTQTMTVNTAPQGAACTLEREGANIGMVTATPGMVSFSKSGKELAVTCNKPGYLAATARAVPSFSGWTFGNLLLGGIVGVVVDASTGANFNYPNQVTLPLQPGAPGLGVPGAVGVPVSGLEGPVRVSASGAERPRGLY